MEIKLDLPADVAGGEGEPLVASELAEAAREAVKRQSAEATKGAIDFYKSWEDVAAQLGALTGHGLEVGFRAKPDNKAVALVKAAKGDLSAGEIATLALEALGFDRGGLEAEVAADGKEYYKLEPPGAGRLVLIVFGPGKGWERLA
jgi:hypothetical protein